MARRIVLFAPRAAAAALSMLALAGCACRPGWVGPYGGVHPPRCVVW